MNKKFFCKDRVLAVILLVISAFLALEASALRQAISKRIQVPRSSRG